MAVPKKVLPSSKTIANNFEIAHTFSPFTATFSEINSIFATKRVNRVWIYFVNECRARLA